VQLIRGVEAHLERQAVLERGERALISAMKLQDDPEQPDAIGEISTREELLGGAPGDEVRCGPQARTPGYRRRRDGRAHPHRQRLLRTENYVPRGVRSPSGVEAQNLSATLARRDASGHTQPCGSWLPHGSLPGAGSEEVVIKLDCSGSDGCETDHPARGCRPGARRFPGGGKAAKRGGRC